MANDTPDPQLLRRDGTSQASRVQAALAPEYVRIDARSYHDLLAFARAYARELRYYDADNQPVGDWRAFLPDEMNLDEAVAFMHDPASLPPERTRLYRRPHVVLFLTFLRLLRHAQDHLNGLTRRHLDFYYQQVLRLSKQPGRPDQVHVLIEVAASATDVLLPAGTLLHAGKDSLGRDRVYRTDHDIVANRVQVAELRSVHAAKRRTDIRAAREEHTGTREEGFMRMLQIALGDPHPGDPLPPYAPEETVDFAFLQTLHTLVEFVHTGLYMTFADLRSLMVLKGQRDAAEAEWAGINRLLERAGQAKRNDPSYRLAPDDPTAFVTKLAKALGPFDWPAGVTTIDDYSTAVRRLEAFVFMAAEDFADVMAVAAMPEAPRQAWDRVYAILAEAYKEKVYAVRRRRLQTVRETDGFTAMLGVALGMDGAQATQETALEELQRYVRNETDRIFLQQIGPDTNMSSEDWDRIYRIVELAQRVREGGSEPVAQEETWINLYAAADATAVQGTVGVAADQTPSRWKTFGQAPTAGPQDSPPPAALGWAISSPLLALAEGKRTITLTLGCQPEQFHLDQEGFVQQALQVEVSTAKGWIAPDTVEIKLGDYDTLSGAENTTETPLRALQYVLTFADHVEALSPLSPEAADIDSPWPILRVMLRQIWQSENGQGTTGRYITHYQPFKDLCLVSVHLKVQVAGLTTVHLQNDTTVLQANRPFEPFGATPVAGSRLYLGHPEVVRKTLDSLQLHLEWMGAPASLAEHYKNYPAIDPERQNGQFTVQVSLVDKRRQVVLADEASLFNMTDASQPYTIDIRSLPEYRYEPSPDMAVDAEVSTWDRYLQWELNAPDFQHSAFPVVATQKTLELTTAITNRQTSTSEPKQQGDTSINAADYQVNPPYTPKVKRLSLDYTASIVIPMSAYRPGAQAERILHIHPFGYADVQPEAHLPRLLVFPPYDNEGELYIGLRDLHPPQNLALLVQMAAGSGDPDLPRLPVQWRYLSGNRWLSLDEGRIVRDTTRDLLNTGIIVFALPPASPGTLLPPNLYWLRAAMPRYSQSVGDTIAIHTRAVSATFVNRDNAPEHLGQPLPAGSITSLVERLPGVSGIRQPYTSYGGKVEEQDSHFYTRVSERLRHKHRALTVWDYEHMILQRFPQVYKVKCLAAHPARQTDAPGRVAIVVIPDIRHQLPANPFEPKAPADLLADIATYLADHTPVWASVHVQNAHYVPVKVRVAVRFRPGYNEGFYKQRLNDDLNHFLSPWAYDEGADIEIGGKIYANVIINFLEERPYVDYVAEIRLFRSEDGRTFQLAVPSGTEGYRVQTDRPDGVLVAAPQHEIDMIPEAGYEARSFTGINYMKLELDFIVG